MQTWKSCFSNNDESLKTIDRLIPSVPDDENKNQGEAKSHGKSLCLIELLFLTDIIEVLLLLSRKHIGSPLLITKGINGRN